MCSIASNSSAGSGDDAWKVWVPAGVAVLAALASVLTAWRERNATNRQNEIAYLRSQHHELYAPLMMLRAESKQLRKLLPDPDDPSTPEWHLVDNIVQVKSGGNAEHLAAAEQILQVWKQVNELLVQKAGLSVDVPAPESFRTALAHSSMLRMYWELGRNQPATSRLPFNGDEFDADIDAAMQRITTRLKELRQAAPVIKPIG